MGGDDQEGQRVFDVAGGMATVTGESSVAGLHSTLH